MHQPTDRTSRADGRFERRPKPREPAQTDAFIQPLRRRWSFVIVDANRPQRGHKSIKGRETFENFLKATSLIAALVVAVGLSTTTLTVTSAAIATPAEAGVFDKAKKGLSLVGKGARFVERKAARMGKFGQVISKGARELRKGTREASRGIGKVQEKAGRASGKICRGTCRKVVKAGNKVRKGLKRVERAVERKCRSIARNSWNCRATREAMEFASPI